MKIQKLNESFNKQIDIDRVVIDVANLLDESVLGDNWIEVFPTGGSTPYRLSLDITGADETTRKAVIYTSPNSDKVCFAFRNGSEGCFTSVEEIARFIAGEYGLTLNESKSIKEDTSKEWKPNTSFKHIKDIYNKVKANNYKYVNNEREEFMAAVKKADNKGYKPEECRQIKDWHREIWQKNRKSEGWSHFEFTSGSNPYIAKTKEEANRIKRSRGDSVRYVGNIDGNDYYTIDDSEEDLFRVDESVEELSVGDRFEAKLPSGNFETFTVNKVLPDAYQVKERTKDGDMIYKVNKNRVTRKIDSDLDEAFKPKEDYMPDDAEYERIARSGTDDERLVAAVSYMFGVDMNKAKEYIPDLGYTQRKKTLTYYDLRDLPHDVRIAKIKELYPKRELQSKKMNESSEEKRDIFCVDCDTVTTQTYKGAFKDGIRTLGRYICDRCGCENDDEPLDESVNKSDYKVKFFQVFEAPKSPKENGKMIGQRGTLDAANAFGKEKVGEGNYIIKAVCDDGQTRPIDNDTKPDAFKMVTESVSGKYGEVKYEPRRDGMPGESAIYANYHLFSDNGKYTPYWAGEKPMGSSYNSVEDAVKGIDAFIDRQRKDGKMLHMKPVNESTEDQDEVTRFKVEYYTNDNDGDRAVEYIYADTLEDCKKEFKKRFPDAVATGFIPEKVPASYKKADMNEASYGGAFDIANDQYFTREDIETASEKVLDHINETFKDEYILGGTWFENGKWIVNVQTQDGMEEYEVEVPVSMRRIRKPSDIEKYALEVASKLIAQIKECNGLEEAISGEYSDKFYSLGKSYLQEDDAAALKALLFDVIRYCPEEDLKDLWNKRGYGKIQKDVDDDIDESLLEKFTCADCNYYWKDEDEEHPSCKFEGPFNAPCEEDDWEEGDDDEYPITEDYDGESEKGPKEGADAGIADLLSSAIIDEWEAIKEYNDLAINARAEGFESVAQVIDDINTEENIHVGQLQQALTTLSPNANVINQGQQEARDQLTGGSANEIDSTTELNDIDDDF